MMNDLDLVLVLVLVTVVVSVVARSVAHYHYRHHHNRLPLCMFQLASRQRRATKLAIHLGTLLKK